MARRLINFGIQQFNSTVRMMSVAWINDAFGHATGDLIAHDQIVLTVDMLRFIAMVISSQ